MRKGKPDIDEMLIQRLNDELGHDEVPLRLEESSDGSNDDIFELIDEGTQNKAFLESAILKHLRVGTKDLTTGYDVGDFLDDENVIALIEHEFSVLTKQPVEQSRAELNLVKVADSPRVVEWSAENQVHRTSEIQKAIETAANGQPTFLIVADGLHTIGIGLLPDQSTPGIIKVVYLNSVYGVGGEKYIASKLTGLDLLSELVGMIGQTDDPLVPTQKLQAQVLHVYLNPTQQLGNNCGVITALNIASLAMYWKSKAGTNLDLTEYGNALKGLYYNVILSSSNAREKVQLFEHYIRSKFVAIRDLEINKTPVASALPEVKSATSFTIQIQPVDFTQVQDLKTSLVAQDSERRKVVGAKHGQVFLESKVLELPEYLQNMVCELVDRHREITGKNVGNSYSREELEGAYDLLKLENEKLAKGTNKVANEASLEAIPVSFEELRSQFTDVMPVAMGSRRKVDKSLRAYIKEGANKRAIEEEEIAKCLSFVRRGQSVHLTRVEFSQAKQLLIDKPVLENFSPWQEIPQFVVITGKNGAGKSQLLGYIHRILKLHYPKLNAFFRDTSDRQYNMNHDNTSRDVDYFLKGEPKVQLIDAAKKYCSDKTHSSHLDDKKIYIDLKRKIDAGGELSDPGAQSWQTLVEEFIDSYQDYEQEKHDVENPLNALSRVFGLFEKRLRTLHEKYKDLTYLETLFAFYCQRNSVSPEDVNSYKAFYKAITETIFLDTLIDEYIKVKLNYSPPWEEINKVLAQYGFAYQLGWDSKKGGRKELVLKRETSTGLIEINHFNLSSGEKVALDLMAWQFYYQGLSADGEERAETQRVNIMLLDEPDSHLDPELCAVFYRIVHEEFVQKHKIQVIMSTHRVDTVALAPPESIYIMEGGGLRRQKEAALTRMSSNLGNVIELASSRRSALSALSSGKLTVVEDVNYVLVENKDDAKFYSMVYLKLLSASFLGSNGTRLIFAPVGVKVVETEVLDRLGELVANLRVTDTANKDFQEMSSLVKSLKEQNDVGNGCGQVEKRAVVVEYEMNADGNGVIANTPTEKPEKHEPEVIWGLLDRDKSRISRDTIYAIEVYSFECYLCMPLNLFYLLKRGEDFDKSKPKKTELKDRLVQLEGLLEKNDVDKRPLQEFLNNLTKYTIDTLNVKINVLKGVADHTLSNNLVLLQTGLNGETRPLELTNGLIIEKCPNIFFEGIKGGGNGHKLEETIGFVIFNNTNYKAQMHARIFGALEKIPAGLLPKSLLTTMEGLVASRKAVSQSDISV
jgi:energy-coupling factor transporter ATP-binding protein EcfA2